MRHLTATIVSAALVAAPHLARAQHVVGQHADKTVPVPVRLDGANRFQDRFARVGEDLYVSGQPTPDALRQLHDEGVTTVVNLRTPEEMAKIGFDEPALIASLGMKYVYLPVRGNAQYPYAPETVDKFAAALKESKGKVLLHCTIAWRASHLWAAYMIRDRGIPVDTALAYTRLINLMDERPGTGRQPIEDFLGRDIEQLKRPRQP